MKTIGVFVDTNIVDRILGVDDPQYEKDRSYLSRIVEQYAEKGVVRLVVNPRVKEEIKKIPDPQKRAQLLDTLNQFHFTPYNKTVFPFSFPATFLTDEEGETLKELYGWLPASFEKDRGIFADAVFNPQIEVLLTADRDHLANDRFRNLLQGKGLDKSIKVFTPKELFEYLRNCL